MCRARLSGDPGRTDLLSDLDAIIGFHGHIGEVEVPGERAVCVADGDEVSCATAAVPGPASGFGLDDHTGTGGMYRCTWVHAEVDGRRAVVPAATTVWSGISIGAPDFEGADERNCNRGFGCSSEWRRGTGGQLWMGYEGCDQHKS